MKKMLSGFVFVIALAVVWTLHAQVVPTIEWQRSLGGSSSEVAYAIQQTTDGGFIVAGNANSNDGDVTGFHGGWPYGDYWIVKLDATGNVVWQKCYGGLGGDQATSVQQTTDGGFIVAGFSYSSDSNVLGHHGTTAYSDSWVIKLDTVGNLVWQKSLGGSDLDRANSIQQTTDGGFIVAGSSQSTDGDVSGNHGGGDYWIVKLDMGANLVWQKSLGGGSGDEANSIQQTTDSGFIVAGVSSSLGGDVTGNHGSASDYWIVKLDANGNIVWEKCLGGFDLEEAFSVQQTTDGGFIIAGFSYSINGDITGHHGSTDSCDYWIVKLSANGNLEWQKSLGGSSVEEANSIQQTFDGGFIITGYSNSIDGEVSGNHGLMDYWIVKLSVNGDLEWQKSLGGSSVDAAYSVQQTFDSGFIVAGLAGSNDGDVSEHHGGQQSDFWIVKLSGDSTTGIVSLPANSISLHPNPVQNLLTIDLAMQTVNTTIRVYDLQGKIIALPTTFTNTQAQLNTAALPDGFYTLQITNNKTGESEVGKFVKQE